MSVFIQLKEEKSGFAHLPQRLQWKSLISGIDPPSQSPLLCSPCELPVQTSSPATTHLSLHTCSVLPACIAGFYLQSLWNLAVPSTSARPWWALSCFCHRNFPVQVPLHFHFTLSPVQSQAESTLVSTSTSALCHSPALIPPKFQLFVFVTKNSFFCFSSLKSLQETNCSHHCLAMWRLPGLVPTGQAGRLGGGHLTSTESEMYFKTICICFRLCTLTAKKAIWGKSQLGARSVPSCRGELQNTPF